MGFPQIFTVSQNYILQNIIMQICGRKFASLCGRKSASLCGRKSALKIKNCIIPPSYTKKYIIAEYPPFSKRSNTKFVKYLPILTNSLPGNRTRQRQLILILIYQL